MAVPIGLGFGDLIKAIKISRNIYVKCFDEDASVKYREFIGNIGTLGNGLSRLKDVAEASERQYPRRDWRNGDAHHFGAAQNLWPQLTGDFYQTLKECESLLARHGRLQNGRATAFDNLNWWLSAERVIENLTAKLKFHITKVEFYATPSQWEVMIRQGRDLQQLRKQVDRLERMMVHGAEPSTSLWAQLIPQELKVKLENGFNTKRPSWFTEGAEWPLKEGFEAVVFHFTRGTVNFNSTPDLGYLPEIQQFLNLAKALWIFEKVKDSHHFRANSTDSIWADYMRELQDDLRAQLHRFEIRELEMPPTQELLGLPDDLYTISNGEDAELDALNADTAGPAGEKLLHLGLLSTSGDSESSLLVFRESDVDFLFVISTKQADVLGAARNREVEVCMDRHRLIPIYGSPIQSHPSRNSIILANERGKRLTEYQFHSSRDVKQLQRALTGYRVHHDMPIFSWRINGSERNSPAGSGFLQLWQHKPLSPLSATGQSPVSDTTSSIGSTGSPTTRWGSARRHSEYAELAGVAGHRVDSGDFVGLGGLPDSSTGGDQARTSSFAEASRAQFHGGKRRSDFSDTTGNYGANSIWRNSQSIRPPSNISQARANSTHSSHNLQRLSSATSGTTQTSRTSVLSPVQGTRNDGVQISKPEPPVLIIFTMYDGRFSFVHLTSTSRDANRK